ncbi:MAG: hypothetical protein U9N07_08165 [Euryarchaeota archaeon]|nr:hypothetical protein [Euryarchaeota archaeon]
MMRFPDGRLIGHITSTDTGLEGYLCDLCEEGFTGIIKCTSITANILLLDRRVAAATFVEEDGTEISGDDAVTSILKHAEKIDMAFDVEELDVDRAKFSLKWYSDIHKYKNVTIKPGHKTVKRTVKEDISEERADLMERFGIPEPDSDTLKGILKKSGIALRDN